MENQKNLFDELRENTIYSYHRSQAIKDGILIDLTTNFPRDTVLYKWPVACTSEVWSLFNAAPDPAVWVWDLCYMSIRGHVRKLDAASAIFIFISPDEKQRRLKVAISEGDNLQPVVTIMLENQD